MNYGKMLDLFEFAFKMQESSLGVSLEDIQAYFNVSKRTAERMRDALLCYFSQLSEVYCDDAYPQSLSYIQEFYGAQLKVKSFLQDYHDYIAKQYAKTDYKTYEDLLSNFPFLGNYSAHHSFRYKPLYRYLNLKEPQFTKALSNFLLENQQSCKAFLQAIFKLLNQNKELPKDGYYCACEVLTKNVKDKKKRRKRIDNAIIWNSGALCIEVKFDAVIDGNELSVYEEQMKKIAKGKELTFVVITIKNIQKDIDAKKEKKEYWKNILWCDVMRLWEQNLDGLVEDEDMKRYRSSLWNKILYWEC